MDGHDEKNGMCRDGRQQEKRYVVASCQDWHRPMFEELAASLPGQWGWAGNQEELEAYVCRGGRTLHFLSALALACGGKPLAKPRVRLLPHDRCSLWARWQPLAEPDCRRA